MNGVLVAFRTVRGMGNNIWCSSSFVHLGLPCLKQGLVLLIKAAAAAGVTGNSLFAASMARLTATDNERKGIVTKVK